VLNSEVLGNIMHANKPYYHGTAISEQKEEWGIPTGTFNYKGSTVLLNVSNRDMLIVSFKSNLKFFVLLLSRTEPFMTAVISVFTYLNLISTWHIKHLSSPYGLIT